MHWLIGAAAICVLTGVGAYVVFNPSAELCVYYKGPHPGGSEQFLHDTVVIYSLPSRAQANALQRDKDAFLSKGRRGFRRFIPLIQEEFPQEKEIRVSEVSYFQCKIDPGWKVIMMECKGYGWIEVVHVPVGGLRLTLDSANVMLGY